MEKIASKNCRSCSLNYNAQIPVRLGGPVFQDLTGLPVTRQIGSTFNPIRLIKLTTKTTDRS